MASTELCHSLHVVTEQSGVVPSSPSCFVDHDPTILPFVPAPSTVTRPLIVQVYSRMRENDDTCHA